MGRRECWARMEGRDVDRLGACGPQPRCGWGRLKPRPRVGLVPRPTLGYGTQRRWRWGLVTSLPPPWLSGVHPLIPSRPSRLRARFGRCWGGFVRVAGRRSVEVGAAHEVVAAGAAELALLVVEFVAAARTPTPVFAGAVGFRGRGRILDCERGIGLGGRGGCGFVVHDLALPSRACRTRSAAFIEGKASSSSATVRGSRHSNPETSSRDWAAVGLTTRAVKNRSRTG